MGIETLFFIAILIISIVIHEVAHGYMAYILGDPTAKLAGRLTLNPLPHIDPVGSLLVPLLLALFPGGLMFGWAKPVPFNPYNLKVGKWGPAFVALAGPGVNLLIAIVFSFFIRFGASFGLSGQALILVSIIILTNIALAVFNLIPVPPLDGSKILFAALPYKWRHIEGAMERGQLFLIVAVIFFAGAIVSPVVSYLFELFTGAGF